MGSVNASTGLLPNGGAQSAAAGLTLDLGNFGYTGPAHYTLDHAGVWRYRHTDVPPFAGARLGYNWMHNSDDPSAWNAVGSSHADGTTWAEVDDADAGGAAIKAMAVTVAASRNGPLVGGVPLAYTFNAAAPLFFPGRVVLARYDIKRQSGIGSALGYFYHRPIDSGVMPTESRPNNFSLPAVGVWQTMDSVMQLNALMYGLQAQTSLSANDSGEYRIARPCFDFASGVDASAFVSHEYIPGGTAGPGWRYFGTLPASTRSGTQHATAWEVLNLDTHLGNNTLAGVLNESAQGAAIAGADPFKGLQQEPASTNLCTADNWLFGIGWGKCSSTGPWTATPPVQSGTPADPAYGARFEALSMMRSPYQGYAANRIALVQGASDTITNADNDFLTRGWRVGEAVWGWVSNDAADGTVFGPIAVTAVAAGTLTLASANTIPARAAAGGRRVRLFRCPKVGDQVLLLLNGEGSTHRTSIAALVLPTYNATFQDKDVLLLGLNAAPPAAGGWAATDSGVHLFYWTDETDFGIVKSGAGAVFDIAYDSEAMHAAGLDDIAPHGLCFKLSSTSGNPTFDFGNGVGAASRWSALSIFAKRTAGSSTPSYGLQSHGSLTTFSNPAWARISSGVVSVGANFKPRLTVNGAGTAVYCIGPQFEQSASATANSQPVTSPIVNPMNGIAAATQGATRGVKRPTRTWGAQTNVAGVVTQSWQTNNVTRRLEFTPAAVVPNVTQTLWAAGDATNGFALLLGGAAGTTWTARKTIAGVNHDSTVTLTPVPGSTHLVSAHWSDTAGTVFSVDGVAGSAQANTAAVAALTYASPEDLGTLAGTLAAFGCIRALAVT